MATGYGIVTRMSAGFVLTFDVTPPSIWIPT
jgi:hypothetical protein